MQFGSSDAGAALIYKRENVSSDVCRIALCGLSPDMEYEIYNYDTPDEKTVKTGAELMNEGLDVTITETPKAYILMYNGK